MSATLEKTEASSTQYPLLLTDRFPERARLSRAAVLLTAVLGAVFCTLSVRALAHTDLFGHLAYGQLIWAQKSLPVTEPLMPLAAGMPFIDTAWLTQVGGYGVFRAWGYVGLQFAHALLLTVRFALLAMRLHGRTHHAGLAILGVVTMGFLAWTPLTVARPQVAGIVCFMLLLYVLTARRWGRWQWIGIPLIFALWANLHGSFFVGLFVLGCLAAGRAWDVFRATGRPGAFIQDRPFRRLFLTLELALAATLLNPYGLRMYTDVLFFGEHPNLADLIEWQPLDIRSSYGLAAIALAFVLAIVYRKSPRRVPSGEVLLVVGLLFASLWSARMLVWWAPVAAGSLVWNLHAICLKARNGQPYAYPVGKSRWTVVTAGLVWISFGYTPFAMLVLHQKETSVRRTLSPATPILAVEYLHKNPPQGQVFNTYEWGDYLIWAGPKDLKVFVASHAHLVPREVWRHYMQVIDVSSDWQSILDKYGVNTVVVDNVERRDLIRRLKDSTHWKKVFDDGLATIFVRKGSGVRGQGSGVRMNVRTGKHSRTHSAFIE